MQPVQRNTRSSVHQAEDQNLSDQASSSSNTRAANESPICNRVNNSQVAREWVARSGLELGPRAHASTVGSSRATRASFNAVCEIQSPIATKDRQILLDNYFSQLIAPATVYFSPHLMQWVSEAPIGELTARHEAAEEIENIYQRQYESLGLVDLNLTSLPDCMFELTNVKKLYLRGNLLNELPKLSPSITMVSEESNDLPRRNTVNNICVTTSDLRNLVPADIQFVENLAQWALIGTSIEQQQRLIVAHRIINAYEKNAPTLRMEFLALQSLPDCFKQLHALENLYLKGNRINDLSSMPENLRSIDLTNNKMTFLPPGLPDKLKSLCLSINRIDKIHSLPSGLEFFEAVNNRVSKINGDLPNGLKKLNVVGSWIKEISALPPSLQELTLNCPSARTLPALPNKLKILKLGIDEVSALSELPKLPESLEELYLGKSMNLLVMPVLPNRLLKFSASSSRLRCCPLLPDSVVTVVLDNSVWLNMPREIYSTPKVIYNPDDSSESGSPATSAASSIRQWQKENPLKLLNVSPHNIISEVETAGLRQLVAYGVNINSFDEQGNGALDLLFNSNQWTRASPAEVIEDFHAVGADFELINDAGYTLLHRQLVKGNVDCVQALLEKGVNVNACVKPGTRNADGSNAMAAGSQVEDTTALHLAARYVRNPRIIELLLIHGAQCNALTSDGKTPLDFAHARTDREAPGVTRVLAAAMNALDADFALALSLQEENQYEERARVNPAEVPFLESDDPENLAATFNQFRQRLSTTAEYLRDETRLGFVNRVNSLVLAMWGSDALRDVCFGIAASAIESCEDRVSQGFNDMELAKINFDVDAGRYSTEEVFALGNSFFKLDALEKIIQSKIDAMTRADIAIDEVEIRLAYRKNLTTRLTLPGSVPSMRYESYALLTGQDFEAAFDEVSLQAERNPSIEFIAKWQPWLTIMKASHPQEYARLEALIEEERNHIAVQPARMSEQEWLQEFDEQKKQEEESRLKLTKRFTRQYLENISESPSSEG